MILDGDVLTHLIEVEHEASMLVLDAQKESDRRLSEARSKADSEFFEKFSSVQKQLKAEKENEEKRINENYQKEINEFKNGLESIEQNTDSLNLFFNDTLFNFEP